ncbi:MAG: hypothetical protein JNG90_08810 [Planctomycetaceae bacterium]|nr:hypothetical protein [Planctomycetaceae bacterium]
MLRETVLFAEIAQFWPRSDEPLSPHLATLVQRAIREFPASSRVWLMYGDFLSISHVDDHSPTTVNNVVAAYRQALALDPACADAYQELGFVYDLRCQDAPAAEAAFRAAIAFGAGVHSYYGLARALAQQGRQHEACQVLTDGSCPYASEPTIQELLSEIRDGMWSLP